MAEPSALGNVVQFFDRLGIYDVVLPFLLVFTIMFAILEKTKVLGTDEFDGKKYTRKNLNAMVAFIIGFLVIASAQLVEIITEVSSNIVVLLMLAVFFLLLVGTFYSSDEEVALKGGWKATFMGIMFVGIILIFLHALKTQDGRTWLQVFFDWLSSYYTSAAVGSVLLIIVIVAFIIWITHEPRKKEEKPKES